MVAIIILDKLRVQVIVVIAIEVLLETRIKILLGLNVMEEKIRDKEAMLVAELAQQVLQLKHHQC